MKSLIKLFLLLYCLPSMNVQSEMIQITFAPNERQQAQWVKSILVKKGIPMDFIAMDVNFNPCHRQKMQTETLLALCLNDRKELKLIKFDRQNFFWQMKPLLEI